MGDHVWLSIKYYKSDWLSKKLDNQMMGPFQISEQIRNTYQLDLPANMKIHNVFSPDKLQKATNDPLPGQIQEPLEPIEINDDEEWEIEEILNSRIYQKKLQYQVKWIGFDEDQTWYYVSNFVGSPHWLHIFHMDYPNHPGPLKRLEHWLQLWENGEDSTEEHLDNDYTQDWGQSWFKEGGYVTALNLSKNLSTSWQWFYCVVIESVT